MIRVTRLNGEQFALNPDLIERVEGHPDTVAFLVDGTKYVVKESVDEVLDEIREYRAGILATSYEMDRGEYRTVVPDEEPTGVAAVSSVVPFPSREER
ncbi:flagellar FlbD family protein [Blastococcus sp. CT_GayMR16]|uniref:flagellar FlbD family protein n=1 Tax=Blastococcus sp. CT_GayMR16 TaxID=2559607 RepID=UPI00107411D0|nr:flagellar FlbD family protein [Blastococcus sp. CT_GayMR16]TFV83087.1 flagellar protein FlbD [Blastococcus sp. CT_GayMR16]